MHDSIHTKYKTMEKNAPQFCIAVFHHGGAAFLGNYHISNAMRVFDIVQQIMHWIWKNRHISTILG
jgi:hypothetical protein